MNNDCEHLKIICVNCIMLQLILPYPIHSVSLCILLRKRIRNYSLGIVQRMSLCSDKAN